MEKLELNKIYCVDCRDLLPEIISQYKDREIIIVSDPPFNMNYHYDDYADNMNDESYIDFMACVFSQTREFVIIHYPEMLYKIAYELGVFPERIVSWVYNSNTPRQHRDIAFFGITPDFNKVRQPYKNPNDKRIKERIANGAIGGKIYDWWEVNQVKNVSDKKRKHPCQMPLEVMQNIVGILPDNALIIDPFCGSGTTCVACKNLKHDYIGIDISKNYCEESLLRLNNIQANGQLTFFTE